jgi:hypothetical protein
MLAGVRGVSRYFAAGTGVQAMKWPGARSVRALERVVLEGRLECEQSPRCRGLDVGVARGTPGAVNAERVYSSIRVPSKTRNCLNHSGCAGHAGAVTNGASVTAASTGISAYSPPASRTSGEQAG